jgi:pentatricopeptide repeat protein
MRQIITIHLVASTSSLLHPIATAPLSAPLFLDTTHTGAGVETDHHDTSSSGCLWPRHPSVLDFPPSSRSPASRIGSSTWRDISSLSSMAVAEVYSPTAAAAAQQQREKATSQIWRAVVGWIDETSLPPGSRLDVRAYTTVLHALSRAGQYERALELFAELRRQGYEIKRDSMFHKAR